MSCRMKVDIKVNINTVFFSALMGCLVIMIQSTSAELCSTAHNVCSSRLACGNALRNYFMTCSDLISGETTECSTRCKKALISLLSTDDREGEAYINCDCAGKEFCELHKSRMQACSQDVLPAMKSIRDDTPISCSLAMLICMADTPCLVALDYYQHNCAKLIRGERERCTTKCNNSLSIWLRQPKARKLKNCVCDGTEDYDCPMLQEKTEKLCYGNNHRHHRHQNNQNGHHLPDKPGHKQHMNMSDSPKDHHTRNRNDTTNIVDANAQYSKAGSNKACASHCRQCHVIYVFFCLFLTMASSWIQL